MDYGKMNDGIITRIKDMVIEIRGLKTDYLYKTEKGTDIAIYFNMYKSTLNIFPDERLDECGYELLRNIEKILDECIKILHTGVFDEDYIKRFLRGIRVDSMRHVLNMGSAKAVVVALEGVVRIMADYFLKEDAKKLK